jgi:hypothetical protein
VQGLCQHAASPDKSQRRLLHAHRARQEVIAIRGQANAVAMAGEQHCSELVFKLLDALGDPVAGHTQRGCRGVALPPRRPESVAPRISLPLAAGGAKNLPFKLTVVSPAGGIEHGDSLDLTP